MNRNAVLASPERVALLIPVLANMNSLTETDIKTLFAACSDDRNLAGRNLLAFTGAQTVSGVMARLALSTARERDELLALIRRVLHQQRPAED